MKMLSQKAEAIFHQHKDNIETIPASIRMSVLANQIKHAETEELVSLYLDTYVKLMMVTSNVN